MVSKEIVEFDGKRYARYPDSPSVSARKYFYEILPQRKGGKALHQAIWCFHNGAPSSGHHIHHIDGDTLNNTIANLAAVSPVDHVAAHEAMHSDAFKQKRRDFIDKIRPLSVAWHGSGEGLAWHSEHGKRSWDNRQSVARICVQCAKPYQSMGGRATDRFCSRPCISRANEASKRYYEQRSCIVCGCAFTVKKSKKQQTCSGKCGAQARKRREAACLQSDG